MCKRAKPPPPTSPFLDEKYTIQIFIFISHATSDKYIIFYYLNNDFLRNIMRFNSLKKKFDHLCHQGL